MLFKDTLCAGGQATAFSFRRLFLDKYSLLRRSAMPLNIYYFIASVRTPQRADLTIKCE
jgi:hypothetical protein